MIKHIKAEFFEVIKKSKVMLRDLETNKQSRTKWIRESTYCEM